MLLKGLFKYNFENICLGIIKIITNVGKSEKREKDRREK